MNENYFTYKISDIDFNDSSADGQSDIKLHYADFLYSIENRESSILVLYTKIPESDVKVNYILPEKEDEYQDSRNLYNKKIMDYFNRENRIKKEIFLKFSKKEGEDDCDISVRRFENYLRYNGSKIESVERINNIKSGYEKEYYINTNDPRKIKKLIDLAATIGTEQLVIEINFKKLPINDVAKYLLKVKSKERPTIYYETKIKLSIHAGTGAELTAASKKINEILQNEEMQYRNQHKRLFLDKSTIYSLNELSEIIPFSYYESPANGFIYGRDKNDNLFRMDKKKSFPQNSFILSDSNIKTASYCISEIEQVLLATDDDIFVIDTEGRYLDLAQKYHGNYITIGPEDGIFSDQLVSYDDYNRRNDIYSEKKEFIYSLLDILNDEKLNYWQHSLLWPYLDKVIIKEYIFNLSNGNTERTIPTLNDLLKVLRESEHDEIKRFSTVLEQGLNLYPILSEEKQPDYKSNRLIIYDISKLLGKNKTLAYTLLFEKIYNQMIINGYAHKYTWIYFDSIELIYETYSGMDHLLYFYNKAKKEYGIPTLCAKTSDMLDSLKKTDTLDWSNRALLLYNTNVITVLNSNQNNMSELMDLLNIDKKQISVNDDSFVMCSGSQVVNLKSY